MLTLILKATNACNLRCLYCSVGDKSREMKMSEKRMSEALEWFAGYAEGRGEKKIEIIFHGGEPLLIEAGQYRRCIERLAARYPHLVVRFCVQTNGYYITQEHVRLFVDYGMQAGISVDGSEYVHDEQRISITGKETYSTIMKNIRMLKERGVPVSLLMVLTRNGLNGNLHFLENFAREDLPLKINPLLPEGEAVNHKELYLEQGEYGEYLIRVFNYLIDHDLNLTVSPLEQMLYGVIFHQPPRGCVFTKECSRFFLSINAAGEIYPCGRFADSGKFCLGTIDSGITEKGREKLDQLYERRCRTLPEDCTNCSFGDLCSGGCSAACQYGDLSRPSSICGDYQKIFRYLYGDGLKKYRQYLLKKREDIISLLKERKEYGV